MTHSSLTITIAAPYETVYRFLSGPQNMTRWAILDVQDIAPARGGWWQAQTSAGRLDVRIGGEPQLGTLCVEFRFAEGSWKVPMRLIGDPHRCLLMVTLAGLQSSGLRTLMHALVRYKLRRLKALLEDAAKPVAASSGG